MSTIRTDVSRMPLSENVEDRTNDPPYNPDPILKTYGLDYDHQLNDQYWDNAAKLANEDPRFMQQLREAVGTKRKDLEVKVISGEQLKKIMGSIKEVKGNKKK